MPTQSISLLMPMFLRCSDCRHAPCRSAQRPRQIGALPFPLFSVQARRRLTDFLQFPMLLETFPSRLLRHFWSALALTIRYIATVLSRVPKWLGAPWMQGLSRRRSSRGFFFFLAKEAAEVRALFLARLAPKAAADPLSTLGADLPEPQLRSTPLLLVPRAFTHRRRDLLTRGQSFRRRIRHDLVDAHLVRVSHVRLSRRQPQGLGRVEEGRRGGEKSHVG